MMAFLRPLRRNGEVVVSHFFSAANCYSVVSIRETKGVGDWVENTLTGPVLLPEQFGPVITTGEKQ